MKRLSFLFLVISFFACSKEKACETNGTGELCIVNSTTTNIFVSINGELRGLWVSGHQACFEMPAQPVKVSGTELNGSFIWNRDVNVPECNTFELELTR